MNQSRRRTQRSHRNKRSSRRSNRKRGGMAPISYRTVSENPQPSERVMQWATTAGAPMPPAAEMRGVAHGGKHSNRRTKRTHHCKKRRHTHCRHKRHH